MIVTIIYLIKLKDEILLVHLCKFYEESLHGGEWEMYVHTPSFLLTTRGLHSCLYCLKALYNKEMRLMMMMMTGMIVMKMKYFNQKFCFASNHHHRRHHRHHHIILLLTDCLHIIFISSWWKIMYAECWLISLLLHIIAL